jgi:glycosyltransferase involved in cell wall biosynthesis
MPEIAGGAALLCDPNDPLSIAQAIVDAAGPDGDRLRDLGFQRAGQFTWGAAAAATLDVYREVADRRRHGSR